MAAPTNVAPEVTETFHVDGMTCDHCGRAVTEELNGICGVLRVNVKIRTGEVTVTNTATPHHR